MARSPGGSGSRHSGSPESLPKTTPQDYVPQGHDFTLQAVIEMQRSVGELTAKVDRLISDVKSQGDKIDGVRMRLAWVAGGAAAVGFLLALGLTAARFWPVPP